MLGGLSPIAKVRRSASTAVFVSHWCAPGIYVNCTNHSGFQDRYVTVCGRTIGSPTVFRSTFLPILTLVSCVLFTLPPTRAGETGQTQTSNELPGLKLAAAWLFDPPPIPPTIEPATAANAAKP